MTAIGTKCINIVRELPLGSGIDIPWTWMEGHQLTNGSLVLPIFDFSDKHIKQTAARVVFALLLLTPFCKAAALCNAGLGTSHVVWCICNIKSFQNKDLPRREFEKAFIRVSTAIYDMVLVYLLSSHFIGSGYLKGALLLSLALAPQQVLQLHHAIFEKAEPPPAAAADKIDPPHLKEECLIQVFAKGLTDTILPPETKLGWGSRLWSVPSGLTGYAMGTCRGVSARLFSAK